MVERGMNHGLPRVFDLLVAATGLILTAPLLAVSAVLIKVTSHGPVIFRQERVGRAGRKFTLFKLRTMSANSGSLITAANDSRVTPIGRILRRYKIDEVPQLWNVVRGEMSIVGPRPEVPAFVNLKDPYWAEILTCRPGLTDPVTLKLRNEEQLLADSHADDSFYTAVLQPYKLKGYLDFVRHRTWRADLMVIYRTVLAVVLPRSAVPPTKDEMLLSLAK